MSVSVSEFRSGLNPAQVKLLDANAGEWTDDAIVERFAVDQEWCDSNYVLSEFISFIKDQPSSGQARLFATWMGVFCTFFGVRAEVLPEGATYQERRQATVRRYKRLVDSGNSVLTMGEIMKALVKRAACSDAIETLKAAGEAAGLELPERTTTPAPAKAPAKTSKSSTKKSAGKRNEEEPF